MIDTSRYDEILRDFNTYRFQGAHIEQHFIGAFIVIKCNDYLIQNQGHNRFTIFDSHYRYVASIPNNVNISVMYCDPQRIVFSYQEYPNHNMPNNFWFDQRVACCYLEDYLFQERLKGLVNSNKHCKIHMYTLQTIGWGNSVRWILSTFN